MCLPARRSAAISWRFYPGADARRPEGRPGRGRKGGRPKKLSAKELKTIRTLLHSNEVPVQDVAAQFGVNRSTLYQNVGASNQASN